MNDDPSISDEYLNAFADGQLAADERQRLLARLESDPGFKARACEVHALKERVKGAYADLPASRQTMPHRRTPAWRQALAAGLLLALGLAGGWLAHDRYDAPRAPRLAGLPPGYQALALSDRADTTRVVVHLDSGESERFQAALDLAEQLLRQPGRQVEIVANSDGLNLLRLDASGHEARIAQLAQRHANLSFVACAQTIRRFQREGLQVQLLPQAQVTSAAINEILARMQQGWFYVRV